MDGRVCEVSMTERAGGTRCCRFHPSLRRIASRGANTCASSLVHVSILTRAFEWSDLGRVKATTTHRSAPLGVLFGHAHLCFGTWQGSLPLYLLLKRCQCFLFLSQLYRLRQRERRLSLVLSRLISFAGFATFFFFPQRRPQAEDKMGVLGCFVPGRFFVSVLSPRQ